MSVCLAELTPAGTRRHKWATTRCRGAALAGSGRGFWLLSAAAHACSLLRRVKWLAGGKRVAEKARWSCTLRSSCAGAVVGTRHRPGITVCPFVGGLKKCIHHSTKQAAPSISLFTLLQGDSRLVAILCSQNTFGQSLLVDSLGTRELGDSGHSGATHPSAALVAWTHQPKCGGELARACKGTLVAFAVPLFLGATPPPPGHTHPGASSSPRRGLSLLGMEGGAVDGQGPLPYMPPHPPSLPRPGPFITYLPPTS